MQKTSGKRRKCWLPAVFKSPFPWRCQNSGLCRKGIIHPHSNKVNNN